MGMRVTGLALRAGDTVCAFLVVRFAAPIARAGLVALIHHLAALVPDAEQVAAELTEPFMADRRLVTLPWSPPDDAGALAVQRTWLEAAAALGLEAAWCYQNGTRLVLGERGDPVWTHGPPPQAAQVAFPVDGYPESLAQLDGDLGLACKLSGPSTNDSEQVVLALQRLWLSAYAGQYRGAGMQFDHLHHAAHLWVEQLPAACSVRERVHHLLWIASQLDAIVPVLHARLAGATTAHAGYTLGDSHNPFVLGGNPLLAVHTIGGEAGVDAWIADQTSWSSYELAQMLRELAVELASRDALDPADDDDEPAALDAPDVVDAPDAVDADTPDVVDAPDAVDADTPDAVDAPDERIAPRAVARDILRDDDSIELDVDAMFEAAGIGDPAKQGDSGDAGDSDTGDSDAGVGLLGGRSPRGAERAQRWLVIAGEILAARARKGLLDPRTLDKLEPLLAASGSSAQQRGAVAAILEAAREHASAIADDHDVN
jgi:hypothetical protein